MLNGNPKNVSTDLWFHIKEIARVGILSLSQDSTVIVIEHNLDVIKSADWVIDLGPEGGSGGGLVVAEGRPEEIVKNQKSYTGKYLAPVLKK